MIKTIIFDLGGVIVPLDFPRAYATMAQHTSVPQDQLVSRISATGLVPRFETGQISSEDFVKGLCEAVELRLSYEQFRGVWGSLFHPHTLIPEELLGSLKQNYRLVLLSNTNALHFELILENYPLLRHFDSLVLSYKVGAMKPSPTIYKAAVTQALCEPHECFFTDDIAAYVEGARVVGIDAEQFLGLDKLHADLQARGVSW